MQILATDSGLERTGYAFFESDERVHKLGDFGCITTNKTDSLAKRLLKIYQEFEAIIRKHRPELIIIERLFFNTNQKTLITISQSQGVLLLLAGQYNTEVEFLTPLQIKQILTGYGRSDKKNVQKMVKLLLSLEEMPKPDDVVDAIACGLAYCTNTKFKI